MGDKKYTLHDLAFTIDLIRKYFLTDIGKNMIKKYISEYNIKKDDSRFQISASLEYGNFLIKQLALYYRENSSFDNHLYEKTYNHYNKIIDFLVTRDFKVGENIENIIEEVENRRNNIKEYVIMTAFVLDKLFGKSKKVNSH